jgi:hypothetical protein
MSAYTIDEVVESYVAIRDVKRTMEKEHEEALKPIQEKLDKIETYLLGRMQEDGVENYKTKSGTAYKSVKTSCQMADAAMYKEFVFEPVVTAIKSVLDNAGLPDMTEALRQTIAQSALWNLVDFRALKKGVEEYIEDYKQVPPGLNVAQTTTVNVRSK